MKIPKHIGIIPDGNRRWALKHSKEKFEGYQCGIKPGLEVFKLASELGVKEITFYGFTVDNCKREKSQRIAFSDACVEAVKLIEKENAEILVIGSQNSKMFPTELVKYTKRVPVNKGGTKVNFLVNYGWDWDISNINSQNKNRGDLISALHSRDISMMDLIIRWGGMKRLSGFLPIQSVYADIYTCKNLWPDFKKEDFQSALEWYQTQDSTKGG